MRKKIKFENAVQISRHLREREKTPRAVPRIDSQEVPKSINFVPKIPEFRDFFTADLLLPSRFLLKGWLVFSLNAQRINERRRKYATEHLRLLRILPFFFREFEFQSISGLCALFSSRVKSPYTFVSKTNLLRKSLLASLRDKCARSVP